MSIIERARAYVAHMPRAISGSGGHSATFAAAVALVKGFALPEHIALDELRAWNLTHADPPWSDADLRYKIRSAVNADKPSGYLLGDAGVSRTAGSYSNSEAAAQAEKRKSWPEFKKPSALQLASIAALRKLPPAALHLAAHHALLRCATVDGFHCFLVMEGTFAQARRMDGEPLPVRDGTSKAKNLPGSQGAFLGKAWLGGPQCPVLLVEGAIGLLEALAAAQAVDADAAGWGILAATSASSRFDAVWLDRLRDRRIRILPDNDPAGLDACGRWAFALRSAGAVVDAELPPDGLKDLGEVAASPSSYATYLQQLFTL